MPLIARDTDFSEPGWKGKTINIPYPGTFVAVDKAADTPVTPQVPTGVTTPLTLNKHKVVPFLVEDFAAAQANTNLMDRYIEPAAIAIAEQVETDMFANFAGLTPTAGTAGTNITAASLLAARKILNDNKAPMSERYAIVSTKDEQALLSDTTLANYFAYRGQQLAAGQLGELYGLPIFLSQLVPAVGSAPVSTKNLVFHKNAFLVAFRPFRDLPAGSGVSSATINDPVSGISIRVARQYDINNIGMRVNLDVLYGSIVLRPNQGVVLLS